MYKDGAILTEQQIGGPNSYYTTLVSKLYSCVRSLLPSDSNIYLLSLWDTTSWSKEISFPSIILKTKITYFAEEQVDTIDG